MTKTKYFFIFSMVFGLGCASSTEKGAIGVERKQLLLVPAETMMNESAQAYSQMKAEAAKKGKLNVNRQQTERVSAIAKKLIPQVAVFRKDALAWNWEVNVVDSPELNAFCMPGGKIMFYSGLIDKLQMTDNEIAAVMGHEMAHALREHGRERYSQAFLQQVIVQGGLATQKISPTTAQLGSALATYAVLMPFGRNQEIEADEMGVEIMARAGYDPEAALSLWKKMASAGGAKPPEILSTHPADSTRLSRIESLLPTVRPLYQQSRNR